MTKLDATAEMTLELAHGAREPSAADKARNLAAVRARLGLVPPVAGAAAQPALGPEAGPRAVAPSSEVQRARELEAVVRARSLWPRLLAAGVATGVVGFWMGLNLGRTSAERELPAAAEQVSLAESSGVPAPAQPALPPASAAPSAPEEVVAVVEEAAGEAGRRPSKRPLSANKEEAARAPSAVSAAGAMKESGSDFLDAVRLLRRAQRALRAGDAAVGSSLLDQLDERFPPGVLHEERQATRVLGFCASGESERAEALARELLGQSPRSIYARRMHQSCVGGALALPAAPAAPRPGLEKNASGRRE